MDNWKENKTVNKNIYKDRLVWNLCHHGLMKTYKPKEFEELLNVSVRTLRRWDNDKTINVYRNPKGGRYYKEEQYKQYMVIQ